MGLDADAIESVVQPLRLDGWEAHGIVAPDEPDQLPDARDFDIVSFGRGALGPTAERLKSVLRTANPDIRIVETVLPLAVRQIEAECDAHIGDRRAFDAVTATLSGDALRVTGRLGASSRVGVTAYAIEDSIRSIRIGTIDAEAGPFELMVPAPDQPVACVVVDADGAEFVHITLGP